MASEPTLRAPGRPRDPAKSEDVIQAAIELLSEETWPITLRKLEERSGVGRAAIYRRWPSLDSVLADALDRGRESVSVRKDLGLYDSLIEAYLGEDTSPEATERQIRRRIHLGILDPELQQQYWRSHVRRRRNPVTALLTAGIEGGALRPDLDIEATLDLLSGIFYYQFVVRGLSLKDPGVRTRLKSALDIVWRGMLPNSG